MKVSGIRAVGLEFGVGNGPSYDTGRLEVYLPMNLQPRTITRTIIHILNPQ